MQAVSQLNCWFSVYAWVNIYKGKKKRKKPYIILPYKEP